MDPEQVDIANEKLWNHIRDGFLEEQELKDAWQNEPGHFGFETFEAYVDGRLMKALKDEVTKRQESEKKED